jgi:hypothetical protein
MKFVCTSVGLVSMAVGLSLVGCGGSTTGDGAGGSGTIGTTGVGGTIGGIGTTGAGGTTGSGAGNGGGAVGIDAACVANVQEGESIPVNLHFLVDRSGSMTCPLGNAGQNCNNQLAMRMPPDRWSAITDALNSFVVAPASSGIGVGLEFFPINGGNNNNQDCQRTSYQIPAVPFALLPGAANGFGIALAQTMPNGQTPTTPALQGAIDFARSQVMANPSRDVAVVLTSDGIPNGCNSTVANAAAAAMAGATGMPPIKTYVIGVGPQLNNLNQIAAAGGTGQAFLIDTNNTAAAVAAQFTAALGKIAAPITCNYTIPTTGKTPDFGAVNVQSRVGASGSPQLVLKVPDAAGCGTTGGWFYDTNTGTPTKITLCPSTCSPLTNTEGSQLQILIGCATQTGPIR